MTTLAPLRGQGGRHFDYVQRLLANVEVPSCVHGHPLTDDNV